MKWLKQRAAKGEKPHLSIKRIIVEILAGVIGGILVGIIGAFVVGVLCYNLGLGGVLYGKGVFACGLGLGFLLGSGIGVYSVEHIVDETGSFWVTVGGSVLVGSRFKLLKFDVASRMFRISLASIHNAPNRRNC